MSVLNRDSAVQQRRVARAASGAIKGVSLTVVLARTALIVLACAWLVPLLWALDTSLKQEIQTVALPPLWIPQPVTFDAYRKVLTLSGLPRWYLNSALVACVTTAAVLALCSLGGYAFARLRFPGRSILYWTVLAGFMVPAPILIIPLFMMMSSWNLVDSYAGILLPQLVSPVGLFIMKQFFDDLPLELEEAARIDGANRFTIFRRIALPLSRSALAALGIFTFLGSWNNFLWPLIVETSPQMLTIPIGLSQVQMSFGIQYATTMAAAVLGAIPVIIVFLLFQRQIIEGVSLTGLKG